MNRGLDSCLHFYRNSTGIVISFIELILSLQLYQLFTVPFRKEREAAASRQQQRQTQTVSHGRLWCFF